MTWIESAQPKSLGPVALHATAKWEAPIILFHGLSLSLNCAYGGAMLGPHLTELDSVVAAAKVFKASVPLKGRDGARGIGALEIDKSSGTWCFLTGYFLWMPKDLPTKNYSSASAILSDLATCAPLELLDFDRVSAQAQAESEDVKPPSPGTLKRLVTKAVYEAYKQTPPSDVELRDRVREKANSKKNAKKDVLAELRGGQDGILAFNNRARRDVVDRGPYQRLKFTDCDMSGVNLNGLDFRGCTFSNCDLRNATLTNANLRSAKFCGSDLSNAVADEARIEGADLSKATLEGVSLKSAWCSKKTVFPDGLVPQGLYWV